MTAAICRCTTGAMFLHDGNFYWINYWCSWCVTQGCSLTRYIDTYLATSRPPWPSKTPKTLHLLSTFNAARCASSCNYTEVSTTDLAHVQISRNCKCLHATDKVVRPALADIEGFERKAACVYHFCSPTLHCTDTILEICILFFFALLQQLYCMSSLQCQQHALSAVLFC